ncbi:MAG: tyrosine-protein phosphatase [Pseudomonadota bacterium]|nr:tyrosine-protein phosphatase [Pseudomonadota bacterium]
MLNFRDLGGYPNHKGSIIRSGLIFRGGCPTLSGSDAPTLDQHRIQTLIDLRTPIEQQYFNPRSVYPQIEWLSLPLVSDFTQEFSYTHTLTTQDALANLKHLFERVIQLQASPVMVHCTMGKDRTGVVMILLMSCLGCSQADTLKEFLKTNDHIQDLADYLDTQMPSDLKKLLIRKKPRLVYAEDLDRLCQPAGGFEGVPQYLIQRGVLTPKTLSQLQKLLLAPA